MTPRQRYVLWLMAAVSGAAVLTLRFLSLNGFPNDHFIHLAGAQQMLLGEWPSRDFADPGMPLMFAASAVSQLVLGRTLLAEAWLVSAAFALAAMLTVVTARICSGRLWVALLATALEVAIFPRSYSYPKVLLYAAGIAAMWWYVDAPTMRRRLVLAGIVAVAFLFRHDHGVWLGAAALLTVALSARHRGGLAMLRAPLALAAIVAIVLLPYVGYVQWAGGVSRYVASALQFSAAEARQTVLEWPSFSVSAADLADANADAWLFWLAVVLPGAAAVTLAVVRSPSSNRRDDLALIAPVILLAVAVDATFLRDPLRARLPDVIVPEALLAAWLIGRALDARGYRTLLVSVPAVVAVLFTCAAVNVVGRPHEQLDRMGLFAGVRRIPEFFRERTAELQARFVERQMPSDNVAALVPVFGFLDRCTAPTDHLLVTTFAPELYVYARRPFAGGRAVYFPGFEGTPADRVLSLARLRRQRVPFAIVPLAGNPRFDDAYPEVRDYLRAGFETVAELEVDGDETLRLMASRGIAASRADPATGWPCPGQDRR